MSGDTKDDKFIAASLKKSGKRIESLIPIIWIAWFSFELFQLDVASESWGPLLEDA